ncbi:uncharacterized protein [Glycine max]|uniref:uncharacterized protein isoform X1 n=1 Tax=Glycine max TaxID=3847 RepID=UPI001B354CD1|nr:uncharacterized protein LOC100305667 isoform X1 [Glycine max]
MASLRSGASSLLTRLSKSLLLHSKNPNPHSQLLLPSLSRLPGAISPQNDAEFPHKQGFLYPCGLPSLRFFLPQEFIIVLQGTLLHQMILCFYSPKERINQALFDGRGTMDFLLGKQPRVAEE